VTKAGERRGGAYVVCLDCGKQFPYDVQQMRIGKAAPALPDAGVLHPPVVAPRSKLRYAMWASAIPAAIFLGKAFAKKRRSARPRGTPPEGQA
jgi:hypothetical protein